MPRLHWLHDLYVSPSALGAHGGAIYVRRFKSITALVYIAKDECKKIDKQK